MAQIQKPVNNYFAKTQPMYPVANFSTNVTCGYTPLLSSLQTYLKIQQNGTGTLETEQIDPNRIRYILILQQEPTQQPYSKQFKRHKFKISVITVLTANISCCKLQYQPTSGYAPLAVQFTDFSQNVTEWNWDFGDGDNSTLQNPSHTFSAAGNYTVSLSQPMQTVQIQNLPQ